MPAYLVALLTLVACAPPPHVVVIDEEVGPVAAPAPRVVFMGSDGSAEPVELPPVWIGVRVSPLPAPLASHVGERGVMVANVVKDSPADKAGLGQYDIVLKFGQTEIEEPAQLTRAIGALDAGQTVEATILRKGREQTVRITPQKRDPEAMPEMKYEEPENDLVDSYMKARGRALQMTPDGRWIMRDLGEMKNLPDALKELELQFRHGPHGSWQVPLPPGVPGVPEEDILIELGEDDDAKVKVQIRVRTEGEDGEIEVTREGEGAITVQRTKPGEEPVTRSYASPEELEQGDPEAFELYQRHAASPGAFIHVRPFGDKADKLRKHFQVEVRKKLDKALEEARQAGEPAREAIDSAREAMERAHEALAKAHESMSRHGGGGAQERLIVLKQDDGSISVRISRDGELKEYEFKSGAEFKEAEPELYERVKDLLE